ncbi:adenylate/guanylate cyclase domain-containing protein [Bradyrhizobium yuanmingense]|uniref:adenylate/guanylate cyclase domain-containing protein n=1 Tax=Bradyrhizobium yuanmingense TaxID=108015 RepID=UPI0012F81EBA|nr:adenylate/guanylate cyclase domain-containing protein [Bradyrhizobium yuanmingense]
MSSDHVERRLAAILAADVAGSCRLIGIDEEGTLAQLKAIRKKLFDPKITDYRGRIVKNTGDGALVEFASVIDALRCAREIQCGMEEQNTDVPQDKRIEFRIGIHVGDVIIEENDIFGDGVNIAARLEGIAEPGGICISSSAHDQVRDRLELRFIDLGEQILKNIARPIHAYAVVRGGLGARVSSITPSSAGAPHLSIVVLPFANMGDDREQDYFVDGVTESLTTDLSRISGAFVIARNTAFTFKGKPIDVKKLGRELNVRYVLEGSIQRAGNRLRVNAQLVDAETGNHLWAERFDKPVADLFDMQDEIVSRLANTLDAELISAEARRAERSPHPDAMDLVFQGYSWFNKGLTPNWVAQARGFFERAIALDPENVEAMVGLARVDIALGSAVMTDDYSARLVAAETTITRVLSLSPNHASAHAILGTVQIFTRRASQGIAECDHAVTLDRNLARAHAMIGLAKYFLGRGAETEPHINEAFRLSPRDTMVHRWLVWVGLAKAQLNADAEAVVWLRRGIEVNRNYSVTHFDLAALLARLGKLDEAQATVNAGLALDPRFTIRRYRDVTHANSDNPVYRAGRERIIEGMRLAGVPEA